MGSGAPRELSGPSKTDRTLAPELHARLSKAVQVLDKMDPDFAQSREDEKMSQMAKAWGTKCEEMEGYLREVAQVLIQSHQLSLDLGVDGGGRGARPFMEETAQAIPKLFFSLDDEGVVTAATEDGLGIARGRIDSVTYAWVERVVVEWVIRAIARKQKS